MRDRASCATLCKTVCVSDGLCRDGGSGSYAGSRPACAFGEDCEDCGERTLCTPASSTYRVPGEALARTHRILRSTQILFLVMGSTRLGARSISARATWCGQHRHSCLFFREESDASAQSSSINHFFQSTAVGEGQEAGLQISDTEWPDDMPTVKVMAAMPAHGCCRNRTVVSGRAHDFFCRPHRASTLAAQYRFLPALLHVRSSSAFKAHKFRWIAIVDDDSSVLTDNLRRVLQPLNDQHPLYLGDFASSTEAFARSRVADFACGGGGSVLSAAALRVMNLRSCISRYHGRCMQSDWMIGGCAAAHNVTFLRELGCGTCDLRRVDKAKLQATLDRDGCFFAQNFPAGVRRGPHSPAIMHGFPANHSRGKPLHSTIIRPRTAGRNR
mmetsp:Transcript_4877/g.10744  ORF Transcript_4877/g.10744 Transcript_4877/m.10744 type:complete len:386 (-) Transcript_4877:188-1345(-)